MLTRRGRSILALGLGVYVVAWAFGSRPLYPVATGLLLVVAVAWVWVRLADRPFRVRRGWGERDHVEGDDVPVLVELFPSGSVLPASVTLVERAGRLGEQRHLFRQNGRRLSVRYVLERLPRGRYVFEEVRAELADPFGLERAVVSLPAPGALLVYPRLERLDRLFSESGAHSHDGRRLLLRRPSGFELHSVREYEQGESLRRVHWPSTARRGQLMVKELEDAPRDEIAVILDADAEAVVADSFDVQVRAAGSILRAHASHARRAVLAVNSAARPSVRVTSLDGDWLAALGVLAEAEPNGTRPVVELLAREGGPASRAVETVVVTGRLSGALATKLVQRGLAGQGVSVVWVDTASFAGRPATVQPELLRLQAAGVRAAVVRRGDSLAAVLGTQQSPRSAYG